MKNYLLLIMVLPLVSCLKGKADYYRDRVEPFLNELRSHYTPQVYDGVMEPQQIPDLDEDQKTLEGIDSNKDGVRDDMEIFINRNFKYDFERENLKADYKRVNYYFKNYKTMKPDERIRYESNSFEDLRCIRLAYLYVKASDAKEVINYRHSQALYNTRERKQAFEYDYRSLAGKMYGDGFGDPQIYLNCSKKIEEKYSSEKR
jgi:hypothetical protein